MASNYKQPGSVLTLTAPYTVASGAGLLVGSIFAVALAAANSSATVEARVDGVWTLAKATGETWSVGEQIYWNNTNKNCTTTASGNTLIGAATATAGTSDTTGTVRLAPNYATLGETAQAANVAALAGTLTGTTDGTLADVADIALSTSDTYSDSAVNTAVNAAIADINLQLKEIQTTLNAEIAALKAAGLQASS